MADGRKAFLLLCQTALHQFLKGAAGYVGVYPDFISYLAAQQLVYRYAVILSGNVVQCHIDGTQCAHDSRSAEMKAAVHVLPVMLNPQRILSDQILPEGFDHLAGGLQKAPVTGFSDSGDAFVGVHFYK